MLRFSFTLVLVAACVGTVPEDLDPAGTQGDNGDSDTGSADVPPDEPGSGSATDPVEPPESIDGVPLFQVPFPCGQIWAGQSRTDHSPPPSIDFNRADDLGDVVVAAASGTVARVENLGNTSYGRWIELNHGNGYRTRYAHLLQQDVTVGMTVKRGQRIGLLGTTGGSTGPHLHYEQRKDGTTVRAKFNNVEALYYGTKNYTSQNACGVTGVVGRVNTGGSTLAVHADASNASTTVGSVSDGAQVTITCQKNGESVAGTYGTSTLWDKVGAGFVSDAYVSTGSDGQVAPNCP
jgi:hypothetical protein